jgi:DNA repair protein RecO (recombination protein O)
VFCGKKPEENAPLFFDAEEGGICCENCRSRRDQAPLAPGQIRWMRKALTTGSAGWVNAPGETAPFSLLRDYTERRLGRRIKSASMLPKE